MIKDQFEILVILECIYCNKAYWNKKLRYFFKNEYYIQYDDNIGYVMEK